MSSGDALFYAFALVALVAAMSSALRHDLHRAARSLKTAGLGVTGLLALAGASLAASLLGAVVLAGHALLGRVQAAVEDPADGDAVPGGRVRASLLVLAFFVIAARVVLIARWPVVAGAGDTAAVSAAVPWIPPVGLAHYLVAALALLCVGLFAAITRRSGAGVAMGVALMQAAATVAVAAAAAFSGGDDARLLAAAMVVVFCAGATVVQRVGNRYGDFAHDSEAAQGVANGISVVLAGVTFALLAGAW